MDQVVNLVAVNQLATVLVLAQLTAERLDARFLGNLDPVARLKIEHFSVCSCAAFRQHRRNNISRVRVKH